jgi:hypothetical protein
MYKIESFESEIDLVNYLNTGNVCKSNIVAIHFTDYCCILIYVEEEY